jgi:hypothetical protein
MATVRQLGQLFVLCGAPATGKTTLLPTLVAAADGLVVIDIDELLENGAVLGVPIATPEAAASWPAYDRMWQRIVATVRRAGHPVLFLAPVPSPDEIADPRRWPPPVQWALLDCPDGVRRERLKSRGWEQSWIDDAMADADQGRALVPTTILTTGEETAAATAARVLEWVRTTP